MSGISAGPIVAGVDGSAAALHAVRWAADEANTRHQGLHLVHAIDDPSLSYPKVMPLHDDMRGMFRERGHQVLREARDAARDVAPGLEPRLVLREEPVAEILMTESDTASLLVLGTRGLHPLGRALVGSITIALSGHAHCPVAVIRGWTNTAASPAAGPVVVGVDGSAVSESAIATAFDEASWRRTPLIAVHTWDDALLAAVFEETRQNTLFPAIADSERELLAQRLAGWQEKHPDVRVRRVVQRGRAADQLLATAGIAQLLVVGSRGRGGVTGMLLGSTSQTVLAHARCPVIVARPPRAR